MKNRFLAALSCALLGISAVRGAEPFPSAPPSGFSANSQQHDAASPLDVAAGITSLDIEPVWSGHQVPFALLTSKNQQFAAYYDAARQMSVAQRTLGERTWKITRLNSSVGWDSHNSIAMAIDRNGYLHLCGNMHVAPLIYFRSAKPLDAASLEKIPAMTGEGERHCTYPAFFHDPAGALIFSYRDGHSGQGDVLYNVYDEKLRRWARVLNQPLLDGEGKMNAYPLGPQLGPDGYYHLSWVWRDSYEAETNHDLSYARSEDLRHWETADGHPIRLPITANTPGVVVDPVPVGGGIINGSGKVGFDKKHQAVLAYQKFDQAGNTQLYFARFEHGVWKKYLATHWHYRWDIHGEGSIVTEIGIGALRADGDRLLIFVQHRESGSGLFEVDDETLQLKDKVHSMAEPLAMEDAQVESGIPGMGTRWAADSAANDQERASYRLRWETMGYNRDQPRPEPWPKPSMLRLIVRR